MTIQEAIKSGKPYKRKGIHGSFYQPDFTDGFSIDSIIAEDWEIQEDKIEITRSQIIKAIAETAKEKASKRGIELKFHGPYGQEGIDSAYGATLIIEELTSFLEKLGFKS